jgi:hypothetical protein
MTHHANASHDEDPDQIYVRKGHEAEADRVGAVACGLVCGEPSGCAIAREVSLVRTRRADRHRSQDVKHP